MNRVRDPWAEIARRIDGVTGGSPEREPDTEDEDADQQRLQAAAEDEREIDVAWLRQRLGVGSDRQNAKQKHRGADDFRREVCGRVPNCRPGRKHSKLGSRICGRFPMRQVRKPHKNRAHEGASYLRHDVSRYVTP